MAATGMTCSSNFDVCHPDTFDFVGCNTPVVIPHHVNEINMSILPCCMHNSDHCHSYCQCKMCRFRKCQHISHFFCSALCLEITFDAELVVEVCLNEGPEASLNGTNDHEFSVFRPCL
jgi:hypothetical protein